MLKRIKQNVKLVGLMAVLAAGFLLPALIQTAHAKSGDTLFNGNANGIPGCIIKEGDDNEVLIDGGSAQSGTGRFDEECQAKARELQDQIGKSRASVKNIMQQINAVETAAVTFFGPGSRDKAPNDRPDLNLQGPGSNFRAADGARIGNKYNGNPFFSVNPKSHAIWNPSLQQVVLPKGDSQIGQIRFVLTDIVKARGTGGAVGDVEDLTNVNGQPSGDHNIFVFRNEFNPSVGVAFQANPSRGSANVVATAFNGSDDAHFFYFGTCSAQVMDGSTWVADINSNAPPDDVYGDPDDDNGLDEAIKKYHLTECSQQNGVFAEALKNAIGAVADMFSGLISTVSGWLADLVDVGTVASVPGLTNAWKTIRDFVNVIFIVILSVIAMATILRIDTEKYSVRALLPRLVFAVIAVNFSLLLVQVMTNLAFILSQPFLKVSKVLVTNPPADGSIINPDAGIGAAAVGVVVLLAVLVSMLILAFFFIVRILVIWLLAALSPFVFLFMILPVTRSLSSMWWKNSVKWIFMAPIAFMILFIAAEIISGGSGNDTADPQDPGFILKVGFFAGALIAAVIIPLKLGGEVMGRAIGGAKFGGKLGAKGGGVFARKTGLAAAAEQRKARAEAAQSKRGAKILSAADTAKGLASAPLSPVKAMNRATYGAADGGVKGMLQGAASAGKWGRKGRLLSEAGQRNLQEDQAKKLADVFDNSELEGYKKDFPEGGYMDQTLGMAQEIRDGGFDEKRLAERAASAQKNEYKKSDSQLLSQMPSSGRDTNSYWNPPKLAGTVRTATHGKMIGTDGKFRDATQDEQRKAKLQLRSITPEGVQALSETGDPTYLHALNKARQHMSPATRSAFNNVNNKSLGNARAAVTSPATNESPEEFAARRRVHDPDFTG